MQQILFGNDSKQVGYFFVISPPPVVVKAVKGFKEHLHATIGLDVINMRSRAHITLCKFVENENDGLIIARAAAALKNKSVFDIRLSEAATFPQKNSGTLYIKIAQPEPVNIIIRLLATAFPHAYHPSVPHLTIARNVPMPLFEKIDPATFDYHYNFICRHVTLLKWTGERYDIIHEAPLSGTVIA